MSTTTVMCPRCMAAVLWTAHSQFRPFCSDRCKNLDLGAWANEEYRIANGEPPPSAHDSDPLATNLHQSQD